MASANRIHPTALVGPGVQLGDGNTIGPFAVLLGPLQVGHGNWIGPHACIGTPAQIRGGEHAASWTAPDSGTGVVIGDRNVIREFVTVHQPTVSATTIGDECYLMAYAHVPHDSTVNDGVTLANSVQVGGHTTIGTGATIGLGATVHQRLWIGPHAMIGMGAVVNRDVPPGSTSTGSPARVKGANEIGLQRHGFDQSVVNEVARRLAGDAAATELPDDLEHAFATYRSRQGARS